MSNMVWRERLLPRLAFGHLQLWVLEIQGDSNVPIIFEGKGPPRQASVVVLQVLQKVELVHHDRDNRNCSWVNCTNCPCGPPEQMWSWTNVVHMLSKYGPHVVHLDKKWKGIKILLSHPRLLLPDIMWWFGSSSRSWIWRRKKWSN